MIFSNIENLRKTKQIKLIIKAKYQLQKVKGGGLGNSDKGHKIYVYVYVQYMYVISMYSICQQKLEFWQDHDREHTDINLQWTVSLGNLGKQQTLKCVIC